MAAPGGTEEGRVVVAGFGIGGCAVLEEESDDGLVAGGAGYG